MQMPREDGFYMPAEWALQEAVWMLWPYRHDNWRNHGLPAQQAFAAVARAIVQTTPVFMGVPAQYMEQARALMPEQVTLVTIESDDAWCRDTGPTIVIDHAGNRRAIDWQFNAWGGANGGLYDDWEQDTKVAGLIAQHHGLPCYTADLILEGGSIHVDGEGTLLTTEECLLNANRNPQLSKAEIEIRLRDYLGIDTVIWLPHGSFNDETNGHIDNMCCFVRPGEVALLWTDDQEDPQYTRSVEAFDILSRQTDAQGRKLKIWKLPQPGPLYATAEEAAGVEQGNAIDRPEGERLAGSYINYLISNRQIIFPLLDEQTDKEAKRIFHEMYPDYLVTGVPTREILLGGGNIHCITQQIPRAVASNTAV